MTLGGSTAVRASRLFSGLDETQAEVVATLLRPFSAVEGETLFKAGAPVEQPLAAHVGEGRLSEPVLTSAGPGDALGELALNGPTTHTATARVLEAVDGFALEIGDFDQLRGAGHPVAFSVLRQLSLLLADRIRRAGDAAPSERPGHGAAGDTRTARRRRTAGPSHAARASRSSNERELDVLADSLRTWELERGATLFTEGAAAQSAFVVLRGAVEVTRERGDRRLRLATLGPGRMLGELSLIDGGPRTASCAAVEPALVLEIEHDVVRKASGRRARPRASAFCRR